MHTERPTNSDKAPALRETDKEYLRRISIDPDSLSLSVGAITIYDDAYRKVERHGIHIHFSGNGETAARDSTEQTKSVFLIPDDDDYKWYLSPDKEEVPWTEIPKSHVKKIMAEHLSNGDVDGAIPDETEDKKKFEIGQKYSKGAIFSAILSARPSGVISKDEITKDLKTANLIDRKIKGFFSIYPVDVSNIPVQIDFNSDTNEISINLHLNDVESFESRGIQPVLWSQLRDLNIGIGETVPQVLRFSSENGFTIEGFEANIRHYIKKHALQGKEDEARMEAVDVLLTISRRSTKPGFWEAILERSVPLYKIEKYIKDNKIHNAQINYPDWTIGVSENGSIILEELQKNPINS